MTLPDKEEFEKTLEGLRDTVRSLAPDEKTRKLCEDLNDTIDTKNIIDRNISFKKQLSSKPKNELSDIENLWLLAYEASEARIAKMGVNKTDESITQYVESMSILNKFIDKEYYQRQQ